MKTTTIAPKFNLLECKADMMAEEITGLTREVERVVTAPYVPSLQVTCATFPEEKTAMINIHE